MFEILMFSAAAFVLYLVGFPLLSLIVFGLLWVVGMAFKYPVHWFNHIHHSGH